MCSPQGVNSKLLRALAKQTTWEHQIYLLFYGALEHCAFDSVLNVTLVWTHFNVNWSDILVRITKKKNYNKTQKFRASKWKAYLFAVRVFLEQKQM